MLAAYADHIDAADPLSGLVVGERPEPDVPEGWAAVRVRAASVNHHDIWSLRGIGLAADRLPMILGCDAAGVADDGREVVVHSFIDEPAGPGPELLSAEGSMLSERHQGTFAETVVVPRRNLVAKPAELSFDEAACMPTSWLTAYRMLFTQARLTPGQTVLVQGAGGGLSTALIMLGAAAGLRVWVTGRNEERRAFAACLGAHGTFEPGARVPERVDAVMDSVGEATWPHSLRALRKGGVMVVAGATSGYTAPAELGRIFGMQLTIVGSVMGTLRELEQLVRFCVQAGVRPPIDRTLPLRQAEDGFQVMLDGEVKGKIVLRPPAG